MSKSINIHNCNLTIGEKCSISKDAKIGYRENGKGKIIIGNNVRIDPGVVLRTCGGIITIMDNVTIGLNSVIFGGGNVQIKNDTLISPNVQIYAQNHMFYKDELIRKQKNKMYGIWISEDCWIGAGSIILDGINITKGCILGAGSVLTQSMKIAYEIWAGNPANFIKKRPTKRNLPFAENEVMFPKISCSKEQKTPCKKPEPPEPPKTRNISDEFGYIK